MRNLFRYLSITSCASLAFFLAAKPIAARTLAPKEPGIIYYFLSEKRLTSHITRTGMMELIDIDGRLVAFTDSNASGKKPAKDADLIATIFADKPYEKRQLVVNPVTYAAYYRSQNPPKSLLQNASNRPATKLQASGRKPPDKSLS